MTRGPTVRDSTSRSSSRFASRREVRRPAAENDRIDELGHGGRCEAGPADSTGHRALWRKCQTGQPMRGMVSR